MFARRWYLPIAGCERSVLGQTHFRGYRSARHRTAAAADSLQCFMCVAIA